MCGSHSGLLHSDRDLASPNRGFLYFKGKKKGKPDELSS